MGYFRLPKYREVSSSNGCSPFAFTLRWRQNWSLGIRRRVGGGEMITREKLERQQREREAMQQAIAAYTGPITQCPPGKAAEGPPRRRASSQDQPKNAPTQNSEDIRNADFTPCFTNEEGQATG